HGHLSHGARHRPDRRGRRPAPGARAGEPARDRRLDHADHAVGQPQCLGADDRREGRGPAARPRPARSGDIEGLTMDEPAVDTIARLVPAILKALYALEFTGRHIAPQTLLRLIEAIKDRDSDLEPALAQSRATAWPERLAPARACLEGAAEATNESLAALLAAPDADQPIVAAYRAMRGYAKACEQLYP